MSKLTLVQKRMLADIKCSINVYVFEKGIDSYTFSYFKDETCARVYTTSTAKSLLSKGVCKIKFCEVEDSLDNCVGVLEVKIELGRVERSNNILRWKCYKANKR